LGEEEAKENEKKRKAQSEEKKLKKRQSCTKLNYLQIACRTGQGKSMSLDVPRKHGETKKKRGMGGLVGKKRDHGFLGLSLGCKRSVWVGKRCKGGRVKKRGETKEKGTRIKPVCSANEQGCPEWVV